MSNVEVKVEQPRASAAEITKLYTELLGRAPSEADIKHWGARTVTEVTNGIQQSLEYRGVGNLERLIRTQYSDMAYLLDHPEIRNVLLEAVHPDTEMDDATFMSRVRQTQWWRTTDAAQRQWDAKAAIDPQTANREIALKRMQVERQAIALGAQISAEQADQIARWAVRNAVADEQLTDRLWNSVPHNATAGGKAAGALTEVRKLAKDYFVAATPDEIQQWALGVARGTISPEAIQQGFAARAKARFAGNEQLQSLIDAGMAPGQFFSDHKRLIAQELELDEDTIDLTASEWLPVTSHADNGKVRPMTLTETRQMVRQRDEWQHTSIGRQSITEMGQGIMQMLGVRG
jgi:hypothetical protein